MILSIEKVTYYVLSPWNSKDISAHSYCQEKQHYHEDSMELSNCNLYCTGFIPIWGQDLIIRGLKFLGVLIIRGLKFLGVVKICSVRMLAFLKSFLNGYEISRWYLMWALKIHSLGGNFFDCYIQNRHRLWSQTSGFRSQQYCKCADLPWASYLFYL